MTSWSAWWSPGTRVGRVVVGVRRALLVLLVVATSLGIGFVLGAVGHRLGPVAVLAVPAALVGLLAIQGRPVRAVYLVVLAIPVGLRALPVGGLQVIEFAVLAAAASVVVGRLVDGRPPLPWPRAAWWPLGVLVMAVLSALGAADAQVAVKQTALLGGGFLLMLVVVAGVRDRTDLRGVVVLLAAVGGGLGLHGLTGAGNLEASAGALVVANRPAGVFASPNELASVAGMTVLLGLALVSVPGRTRDRAVGFFALVGGGAGLLVTLSRGAWFGTGVAVLLLMVLVAETRRRSLRIVLPLVVLVGLGGSLLLPASSPQLQVVRERVESLARVETSPYDGRTAIWQEGTRQVLDRPLLGQGPGNFPVVSQRAVSEAVSIGAEHAHNVPLTIAAELGLLALGLTVGFTLALVRVVGRYARARIAPADRVLVVGVGCALSVQVAHGLVDYTLRNAVVVMTAWLLAGLVVASSRLRLLNPSAPVRAGRPSPHG